MLQTAHLFLQLVDALHAEYNAAATSTITIKWQSSDSFEKNLERIITQKYLAIYLMVKRLGLNIAVRDIHAFSLQF